VAFSAGGDGGSSVLLEQSARRARSAYMCGVVRNGCCDASAPSGAIFKLPLPADPFATNLLADIADQSGLKLLVCSRQLTLTKVTVLLPPSCNAWGHTKNPTTAA